MVRIRLPLLSALVVLLLASCIDNPDVQNQLQREAASASPSPGASGSLSPSPTPSGSPSGSPAPSASPSAPGRTGLYSDSPSPLDVAIAGPGYFVVATRPDPQGMQDLRFTRDGHFQLLFVPAASPTPGSGSNSAATVYGPGRYLIVTSDGLYAMGVSYPGNDQTPLPGETSGTTFPEAFQLRSNGMSVPSFGAIGLPTATNTTVSPSFTARGQLWNNGLTPTDTNGQPLQIFLAVVDFDQPQGLSVGSGATSYGYTPQAGWIHTGIAGAPDGPGLLPRPVGDANTIRPNTLEDPGV